MKYSRKSKSSSTLIRSRKGNLFAEFAMCLFFMLMSIFFPLINMMALGAVYVAGFVLVDMQSHEASLLPYQAAQDPNGKVRELCPREWVRSSLGNFAQSVGSIETDVEYGTGVTDEFGFVTREVKVNTQITVSPFLCCPFPLKVPGLNAPVPICLSSHRLMEDPTNAP